MPTFSRDKTKKMIQKWIVKLDKKNPPQSDIIAINFGLFEPYGIELTGARTFDNMDDDWACDEDYVPQQRACPKVRFPDDWKWQDVQKTAAAIILELIRESPDSIILNKPYIATGFNDGDLFLIRNKPASDNGIIKLSDLIRSRLAALPDDARALGEKLCTKLDSFSHAPTNSKECKRMEPFAASQDLVSCVAEIVRGYELSYYNALSNYDVIGYYYCIALLVCALLAVPGNALVKSTLEHEVKKENAYHSKQTLYEESRINNVMYRIMNDLNGGKGVVREIKDKIKVWVGND